MDGFEKHGMNEDNFAAQGSIVSAFDAFRTGLLNRNHEDDKYDK